MTSRRRSPYVPSLRVSAGGRGDELEHLRPRPGDPGELVRAGAGPGHGEECGEVPHLALADQEDRLANPADPARRRDGRRVDVAEQAQAGTHVADDDRLEVLEGAPRPLQLGEELDARALVAGDAPARGRP